jgi:hypothetical protein
VRLRIVLLVALASIASGCGGTRTVTGEVTPQVAATITLKPAPGVAPSKAEADVAINVITERLKTLGAGNFSIAAGNDITVSIADGIDLFPAQLAVQTPGVLGFVLDLDASASPPAVGDAATAAVPLWDGDEVAAVSTGKDSGGQATVAIQLTDAGATAFTAFTAGHAGERLVITLDQRVFAVVTIEEPAAGGTTLTLAAPDFMPVAPLSAILLNGPLPAGWRQP